MQQKNNNNQRNVWNDYLFEISSYACSHGEMVAPQ